MTLQTILEELLKYQKIACSENCKAKNGIERVSISQAVKKIEELIPEEKNNQKAYFTYQEGFDDGWDACIAEIRRRMGC